MAVPHATHDAMRHAAAPMASHDCCDHGRPSHPGGDRCPHPCHAVGASAAVLPALPTLAALRPLPARFASVHAAPASLPHVPLHRPPISRPDRPASVARPSPACLPGRPAPVSVARIAQATARSGPCHVTSSRFTAGQPAPPLRPGLALGGIATGLAAWTRPSFAAGTLPSGSFSPAPQLVGSSFDLAIDQTPVNLTGRTRPAITVNGTLPAPILRWKEGDTVSVRVANRMADVPTSVHWHGIVLPADMDGVPGMSFDGIAPGEAWLYRFTVRQAGTYWYHSHSMFQEQAGLYGALLIDRSRHRRTDGTAST
jgi:hypothetical protein